MGALNPTLWPLWFACFAMLLAALGNLRSLRVPNRLTLAAIVAGWLEAIVVSATADDSAPSGGLAASLAGTAMGFFVLLPLYRAGWLGAGCVKMQMAFGAWGGCALAAPQAILLTIAASLAGILFTAAAVPLAFRRLRAQLAVGQCTYEFPAQATLSMGSVAVVIAAATLGLI